MCTMYTNLPHFAAGENVFAPVLQRYMFSNSTTSGLGGLQIENNPIQQYWINAEARVTIVEEWIRILSLLPSVLDVKFAGCNIDDKQFQRIVEALQRHNSTVEFLNVGGNQISDLRHLAALNKLKILHMTGNAIVDVSGLRNLSSLNYLDLSINGIRSVEPLRQLIKLEHLLLCRSQLFFVNGCERFSSLFLSFSFVRLYVCTFSLPRRQSTFRPLDVGNACQFKEIERQG